MATFNKIDEVLRKISFGLSYISMVAIFVIMLITFVTVVLRYLFSGGVSGTVELTEFGMVIIIFFGLSYTQYVGGHVHVDIITDRIRNLRARFVFNGIVRIITGIFCAFVAYAAIVRIPMESVSSGVLLIPLKPFVVIMAVGLVWFTVILIIDGLKHVLQGLSKEGPTPEKTEAEMLAEQAALAKGEA